MCCSRGTSEAGRTLGTGAMPQLRHIARHIVQPVDTAASMVCTESGAASPS